MECIHGNNIVLTGNLIERHETQALKQVELVELDSS